MQTAREWGWWMCSNLRKGKGGREGGNNIWVEKVICVESISGVKCQVFEFARTGTVTMHGNIYICLEGNLYFKGFHRTEILECGFVHIGQLFFFTQSCVRVNSLFQYTKISRHSHPHHE